MSFFGVDIPRSSEITVKIRFITGRGQPFIAWQGSSDANEAEVLQEICQSPLVGAYIKKASANRRIKPDETGAYRIQAKVISYESGQLIHEGATEITIYPIASAEGDGEGGKEAVALDVIRTLVESMTQKEEHLNRMIEHAGRMQDSYQKAIAAISQHSLLAMDKVSNHAAVAFSAAAAPFAEMGKSLVKAVDDSRSTSATSAKDAQDLLVEALRNRIIEANKVTNQSVAQDIKEVLTLWPMFKGILGETEPKPTT